MGGCAGIGTIFPRIAGGLNGGECEDVVEGEVGGVECAVEAVFLPRAREGEFGYQGGNLVETRS